MTIKAPYYGKNELRIRAAEFLGQYHPDQSIPVPIESIVEYGFGMDIVPMPGMHRHFDIDAYLTSDLAEIRIDQDVYEGRENRYRFSLAHELAHRVLHHEIFRELQYGTIAEWKQARGMIPEREYRFLEWHANEFAGLVLVPPSRLATEFESARTQIESIGFTLHDDPAAWDALETILSGRFVVSQQVIAKRGPADDLWDV